MDGLTLRYTTSKTQTKRDGEPETTAPDPHEGTLQAFVQEGDQPAPGELVRVADLADETVALQYTAPDGLATFVLPPQTLTVSAGDVSITTRVHAHTTTSDTLVLEPLDPPEP